MIDQSSSPCTPHDVARIQNLFKAAGKEISLVLAQYEIPDLALLTAAQAESVIKRIKATIDLQSKGRR